MKMPLIAAAMAAFASPAFAEEMPSDIYWFMVDLDFVEQNCTDVKFAPDAIAKVNDKVRELRARNIPKGPDIKAPASECQRRAAGLDAYAKQEFGISGFIATTDGGSHVPEHFDTFLVDLGLALGECRRAGHIHFNRNALDKVNKKIAELKCQGMRYISAPEEPPSDPSELRRVCRDVVSYWVDDFAAEQLGVPGLVIR